MSLLIEALKKAEDDARKRKLAAASSGLAARHLPAGPTRPPAVVALPAPVKAHDASSAEFKLALQSGTPAMAAASASAPNPAGHERVMARSPEVADFPELTLASTNFSAAVDSAPLAPPPERPLDPKPPATPALLEMMPTNGAFPDSVRGTQSAGRSGYKVADKTPPRIPREPIATGVMAARSVAYSGGVTSDTTAPELTLDMAATANVPPPVTPRQAMSAASVMAGKRSPGVAQDKQRRQAVFLGLAVLMALPVAAFYLFGDALFNSTGLLSTSAINRAPPAALSPAAVQSAAPLVASASPASAVTVTAPLPAAIERRTPVPRPVRATDNARRASTAPATVTAAANQAAPAVVTGTAKPASLMASAYAAYQTGKPDEAARLYREVLKTDPGQRDAWLGLAVIAHADNQREPAMDAYKRVLRLEPQNATALAGLSSLNSASDEPRQESRLRELLARSPQEADLNHALGLALSGEQRWSEAQPLFFKAHALAPQEPKFAYNLAVTLDHLRKSSLAIQYYDTALTLARGQSTAFDEQSARNRLAVLKAAATGNQSP